MKSVFKALEEKRAEKVIGKSLEAHVRLHLNEVDETRVQSILGKHDAQWFIVSKLELVRDALPEVMGYEVSVEKVEGHTCPRCWNIVDVVGEDELCLRCHDVVKA
ncbi:hypothetical protein MX850_11620 [Erysipelothrix sp. Poltava]|nr:hypothetical protein MX850_11620 [Erysipelothrix sp. Poltava]